MSGDHTTLNAQGACASVKTPTARISTPIDRIQSGNAIQTRPSGSPDEKESSATDAVRQDRIALERLAMAPRRFGSGEGGTASPCHTDGPCDTRSVNSRIAPCSAI